MFDVLLLTLPFFGIILAGSVTRRIGFFGAEAGRVLARFAFYIALPPFLFLKVGAAPPTAILNPGFIIRYELGTILIFTGGALLGWWLFRLGGAQRAIFGLNAAYPNYGYIGVPLSVMAFGQAAALPLSLILLADSILLVVLTAGFAALTPGVKVGPTIGRTLRSLLRNPLLLSVVAGFLWALSGWQLPVIPQRFFTMLAGAAAPSALFSLGITLAGQKFSQARAEISVISLFKLILHPALIAALFLLWPGVEADWIKVAILAACLPVAANVFVMAETITALIAAARPARSCSPPSLPAQPCRSFCI